MLSSCTGTRYGAGEAEVVCTAAARGPEAALTRGPASEAAETTNLRTIPCTSTKRWRLLPSPIGGRRSHTDLSEWSWPTGSSEIITLGIVSCPAWWRACSRMARWMSSQAPSLRQGRQYWYGRRPGRQIMGHRAPPAAVLVHLQNGVDELAQHSRRGTSTRLDCRRQRLREPHSCLQRSRRKGLHAPYLQSATPILLEHVKDLR